MNINTILPLLSAICTLFLGGFVLLKNPRNDSSRVFFLFSLAVTIWLGGTAVLLTSCQNAGRAIFWDRFIYLGVIFIPPTCLHFSNLFTKIRKQKFLITSSYALSVFFFLVSRTDFFVQNLIKYSWGCHTSARLFHTLFLLNFIIFIVFVFRNLIKGLKKASGIEKTQIKFILAAFTILGIGILGFLPAYGINIYPFAYISGLLAVVIIFYAILKHRLLNVKIIATEAFSIVISIFLLLDAFFVQTLIEFILKLGLFLVVSFFSYLLVRGVMREIKAKERIAKISEDLKMANAELKRLDKSKSEFLSIASHQLRTPLTAIKGYSSMLLENEYGQMPSKIKEIIEKIFISSRRLVAIVDDFLNISIIEAGKMKYDIVSFDLHKMIKDMVSDFATNNEKAKKLNLQFLWEDKNFIVKADQNKIAQVVSNIIDNALKYTSKGSVEVHLSKNKESNTVLLKVKDTGIGFSKETLSRLFQKFTRAKDVSKLHTDGSGLGLYVAKKIIEDHRGKVWAESKGKNKGSTFFVELPID